MLSAPRLRATTLIVATLVVIGSSCAVRTDATGWDDPLAKTHFVDACRNDTEVVRRDGENTVVRSELASERFCTCVFEDLTTKHKLAWEDMLEYEKAQSKAKDGELPTPPKQVTQAVEACRSADAAGPAVPESE